MIYSVRGTLILAQPGTAVVECGGVGYQCSISHTTLSTLPPVGSEVRLFTFLAVREDAVELFGFYGREELECFRLLTSVNGVGNKLAMAVLSDFTPDRLSLTIASGDAKGLTAAPGVGNKLAQRIVLELRDKVAASVAGSPAAQSAAEISQRAGDLGEAAAALAALGYSQTEAASALRGLDESLGVEELIRQGLRKLSANGRF